jgi:hypothetical protein
VLVAIHAKHEKVPLFLCGDSNPATALLRLR